MVRKQVILCLLLHFFSTNCAFIRNVGDCGYLVDQLMNYLKAMHLAEKYNVPFQLAPFPHSDKFVLHNAEPKAQPGRRNVQVKQESQLTPLNQSVFYNVSYYCRINGWSDSFDVNTWDSARNNKIFMAEIRRLIALKNDRKIEMPKNTIAIAIHVRKPLKNDYPDLRSRQLYDSSKLHKLKGMGRGRVSDGPFPEKFLPDQFYIDQVKRIQKVFPQTPIRVYLFTNYEKSQALCGIYQGAINKDNVEVVCKSESWASHIADDLIALSKFDYLIRSKSNFSQIADFIGNHKMVLSPFNVAWYKNEKGEDCLVVEKVVMKIKNGDGSYTKEILNNMEQ